MCQARVLEFFDGEGVGGSYWDWERVYELVVEVRVEFLDNI